MDMFNLGGDCLRLLRMGAAGRKKGIENAWRNDKKLADALAAEGMRLIKRAMATKQTKRRTGNQIDAYGYVVISDGAVVREGFLPETPQADKEHKAPWRGWGKDWRYEAAMYFQERAPLGVWQLVVYNAAGYTVVLENGIECKRGERQFMVLSQVMGDLAGLSQKYGGWLKSEGRFKT